MNAELPVIKKGRKFDQVIEGATRVFMRDGFDGASVDDIAHEAKVSKATLYSYFNEKRVLFMEVARIECTRQADAALDEINMALPPHDVLRKACKSMMRFFYSDFGVNVFRIAVAESSRFPELGRAFYLNGPMEARKRLIKYLETAIAKGYLVIDDIDMAADQLPQLCKADLHEKLIFGIQDGFTEEEIDRIATAAVDLFLSRYGA